MPQIVIYTTSTCPYCRAAKQLLELKKAAYREISVDGDPAGRAEMSRLAEGRHTVPQIFIDGRPIGGCDDLYALESAGELDGLLAASEKAS
ncbi:glutaredoxin 3 [Methylosinus sp. Sm6]|uniref:glutaredoxin 3 n=1 Tax=Methylosinus sp. Sm6 TaxID=2866948 RepID=UPI001C99A3B4|nr:glutaredoxin 3 [Methylosinus sp. Sm6]MBY6242520.1 glutaredoxin 3 [Methylosinus sp. Sm6]